MRVPVSLARLALLLPLACAACASGPRTLPDAVPADFSVEIRSEGATNPHCEFDISVDASGSVAYSVRHLGRRTGDRRGVAQADGAAVADLWTAVAASGIGGMPAVLPPQEGREELGTVRYRVRGGGLRAEVTADRAFDPGLNRILRAAIAAVPWRAWQIPGEAPP